MLQWVLLLQIVVLVAVLFLTFVLVGLLKRANDRTEQFARDNQRMFDMMNSQMIPAMNNAAAAVKKATDTLLEIEAERNRQLPI